MPEWTKINISTEMMDYIRDLIGKPKVKRRYHFVSVADFIRAAIREKIKAIEGELKIRL